jgi:hypothetical protein
LRAVLVTGPVASGKTAVAQEMVSICEERGLPAAAIDLDWLGWSTGGSIRPNELIARNLAAVAANYAAAGIERLVLARAYVGESNLEALKASLPGWKLAVVSLEASRETLEERVRGRDSGAELEHHLGHIAEGHQRLHGARAVSNERGRELREVALEVMRIGAWI